MFPKNQGAYFLALIGIILLLYSFLREKIISKCNKGILKYMRIVFTFGFCFMLVTLSSFFISVIGISGYTSENGKDAIIVLGAGLNGSRVSKTLSERLDAAIEYYNENPEIMIVVSGGQGADQIVSEAFAMQQYLITKGVDENNILLENKSTSTKENFYFSRKVLDDYFDGETYTIAYITNDFHCYRAGRYAAMAGLDTYFIPARTPLAAFPAYCARDYLGNIYLTVFGS
jgi:uncharacterized SAM-binding protein YcdF (DUF218 family)